MNDKEATEQIAAMPKPDEEWAPSVSEYDLQAHLLREILQANKALIQVTIAAAGGKPGSDKPFPAPRTEIDRAIAALERDWAESFVGKFGFDAADI